MSSRPSSRPTITEPWPKHRRNLTMSLKPSDKIYFRSVNERCNPEIVGAGNMGKYCTVIIGHKEIEGIQKIKEYRGLEEYQGLSVEIFPQDEVYTCLINSVGVPSSVGAGNAGKEVTVIVHGEEEPDEAERGTDKAEKIKRLTAEFIKTHERLNELAKLIHELETE